MAKRSKERTQFYWDVTITAIEGGVNYWASVIERNMSPGRDPLEVREDFSVKVLEEDGFNRPITVTIEDIAGAINAIVDGKIRLADSSRMMIAGASAVNDAGEIDADLADVIFQVAALGEVVYG